MLSRTADHIYWLGRYVERAENLARMMDVQHRLSMLPQPPQSAASGWGDTLDELGMLPAYTERHGPRVEPATAIQFIAFDRESPASVYGCLRICRENAQAVRGTITAEMWATLNATWLEARSLDSRRLSGTALGDFIEWVKYRSQLLRGVMGGTMLHDEAFSFLRMGTFIERGDCTARMLGARLANVTSGRGAGGFYQWSVLLHALSAFDNYRRLFRDAVTPERVAELLILCAENPRSLRRSVQDLYAHLGLVRNQRSEETERRAGELHAQLRFGRIDALMASGLRDFLDGFVESLRDIDQRLAADFLVASHGARS